MPQIQRFIGLLVTSKIVQSGINLMILLNVASLGLLTYTNFLTDLSVKWGVDMISSIERIDFVFTIIFLLEIILRAIHLGKDFPKDHWNIFDLLIVGVSTVSLTPVFTSLRALRIFRTLRLVSRFKSMRIVSSILYRSITGAVSISVVIFIILFIFSLITNSLFGEKFPDSFGNLHAAMYTLFRISAFYAAEDVANQMVDVYPYIYYLIIPYFIFTTYVMISFFSAIVVFYLNEVSYQEIRGRVESINQNELVDNIDIKTIYAQLSDLKNSIELIHKK